MKSARTTSASTGMLLVAILALCTAGSAAAQACNCVGCPCCESETGGPAFCEPDSSGVETVCLNIDLDGNFGSPTCHACGDVSGAPCCAPFEGNDFPRCINDQSACVDFVNGNFRDDFSKDRIEEGYLGYCECDEVSQPNPDTGVCETVCGSTSGASCCYPDDSKPYCDRDPLGEPLACLNFERDGLRVCAVCGFEEGRPCCNPGLGLDAPEQECRCVGEVDVGGVAVDAECSCIPNSGTGLLSGEDTCQLTTPLPPIGVSTGGEYGNYGEVQGVYGE